MTSSNTQSGVFVRRTLLVTGTGATLGLMLFCVEVLFAHRGDLPFMGAPLPTIAALYAAFGVSVGIVSGVVAGLVVRLVPTHFFALSLALQVLALHSVFALRGTPSGALLKPGAALVITLIVGWLVVGGLWYAWQRRHFGTSDGRSSKGGALAGAVMILVGVALGLWEPVFHSRLPDRGTAGVDSPNIVVVLVDALRADRLSSYGYERPTSPNIDALAGEGVRFSNAYAHGNRTIISTPSLFTSMYPSFHGAIGFQEQMAPLPQSRTTFTEICRDAGYTTLGMMSNIYLKTPFGQTQGFDRVEEFNPKRFSTSVYRLLTLFGILERPQYAGGLSASATEVTDLAVRWLDRVPASAPVFMYVHYMDVHHPYYPPPRYEEMFRSGGAADQINQVSLFNKTVELVKAPSQVPFSGDELQRLSDLYDGCIRYTDAEVGRLIDRIKRIDNGRETIIVFTSDHGDEFMEHGSLYHTNLVTEELIRVPLIIWRSSDTNGRDVDELTRHVDVLPTIADWVGMPVPEEAMGKSLEQLLVRGDAHAVDESIAEGDYCAAIVRNGWKLMLVDTTNAQHLFDLRNDPLGLVDVSAGQAAMFAELSERLREYLAIAETAAHNETVNATDEALEQLKALGYVN